MLRGLPIGDRLVGDTRNSEIHAGVNPNQAGKSFAIRCAGALPCQNVGVELSRSGGCSLSAVFMTLSPGDAWKRAAFHFREDNYTLSTERLNVLIGGAVGR